MNKAFVKEQEEPSDRCQRCDSTGQTVFQETLAAHLPVEALAELAETACFCPLASCEVAYFDQYGRAVSVECLLRPVYPKDLDAPICPCFGLLCDDIEEDVREGVVTRVRAHRRQTESENTLCATASPSGQSCIAAVQRYYMKLREQT